MRNLEVVIDELKRRHCDERVVIKNLKEWRLRLPASTGVVHSESSPRPPKEAICDESAGMLPICKQLPKPMTGFFLSAASPSVWILPRMSLPTWDRGLD